MSYKCLSILQGVFFWTQLYFVPWISPFPCCPLGRRKMNLWSRTQDPSPKGFGLCGGYRNMVGWDVHCRVSSQQWPLPKFRRVLCWAWRSCCQGGMPEWCLSLEFGSCQLRLGWAERIIGGDAPVAPQPAAPQTQQCPFLSLPRLVSQS